jgi:thioredoxin reductase/2-polyprenyl-3-methyl-5-hydroxy-6-metoxy-1,4-benzoquinol methylase
MDLLLLRQTDLSNRRALAHRRRMDENYDVVVVGGGAAGLSGAVALARSRRRVLVADAGEPRNASAGHAHNFLTRDGTPPERIYALGREEVARYGGRVESGRVTALGRDGDPFTVRAGFTVRIGDRTVTARRLLVATGLRDELPDVPGLAPRWGIDVLHCPYCHGWEVRDRRIGILATGSAAMHQALLFRQLSPHVTVLRHTACELDAEQLSALGIAVVEGPVAEVEAGDDGLTGARLADGTRVPLDALVVAPRMTARAELLAPLGLFPAEVRRGEEVLGTRIEADPAGATGVPGVWVAGNLADIQAQVITAAAAGLTAAAAINADLVAEDARRAVERHRAHQVPGVHGDHGAHAVHGEAAWDERYRSQPEIWSGAPNPVLVAEAAGLPPGTAFDAGAGEGGDACWLAERGWKVTAADISAVALERAAARAGRLGLDITWLHADLTRSPAPQTYDLVTAHFLHMPAAERKIVFRHLADAVAPGGTLLIVGHDFGEMTPPPHLAELWWPADEPAAMLGEGWTVEVAEVRPREDGDTTRHDAILRARRAMD